MKPPRFYRGVLFCGVVFVDTGGGCPCTFSCFLTEQHRHGEVEKAPFEIDGEFVDDAFVVDFVRVFDRVE